MKIIYLFISFILISCSNKIVRLCSIDHSSYFILRLENAEVYYPKEIVMVESKIIIEKEKLQSRKEEMLTVYKRLNDYKLNTIYILNNIDNKNTKEEIENTLFLSLIQDDLLKKGKVKVYNKLKNKFEDKILYKVFKNKLGESGISFSFSDGAEFYYHTITLGE